VGLIGVKRRRFVVDEFIDHTWAQMRDVGVLARKDAEAWALRISDQGRQARVRELSRAHVQTKSRVSD
jgi:hypothetical protein